MTVERAISIAADAHAGQEDKQGKPYIFHVLRVMMAVPDDLKIAAVLHDVVEDTPLSLKDLAALGVENQELAMISLLTRGKDESYDEFIKRLSKHSGASQIKVADLKDNLDPARGPIDESLDKRYRKAFLTLVLERFEKGG